MYYNIRSNLGIGVHTKFSMPRFPVSHAELERLLGFTVNMNFTCQEATGVLTSTDPTARTLAAQGTPQYRKPLMGIAEQGAKAPGNSVSSWYRNNDFTNLPGTTSYFLAGYMCWDGTDQAVNIGWGVIDGADGANYTLLNPTDSNGDLWQHRAIDDSSNVKSFTKTPAPSDKMCRAVAALYDATTGNVSFIMSSTEVTVTAMGAWAGLSAVGVTTPQVLLGGWPGINATGMTFRDVILANGATLDGKGAELSAIMRRLGWQF